MGALASERRARSALEQRLNIEPNADDSKQEVCNTPTIAKSFRTTVGDKDLVAEWVHHVYARYNPGKRPNLELLLAEYRGRESELVSQIAQKYRVKPPLRWQSLDAASKDPPGW